MSLLVKTLRAPYFQWITPAFIFMVSTMLVNAGNYGYNLVLGRVLSPAQFSEAGLIITLFLATSFLAMTFQIVATKYTIDLSCDLEETFRTWIAKLSLIVGGVLALLLLLFYSTISEFFNLSDSKSLIVLALMLPLFFLMSVKRGFLQGKEHFLSLSTSYQVEMWGRLMITLILYYFFSFSIDFLISIAVMESVVLGYMVIKEPVKIKWNVLFPEWKRVIQFTLLTAGYEGAQILINYADILLVKHYFDPTSAGLYTSMALIGRMIYFMTWMVVMILIPRVLKLRNEGGDYRGALVRYFMLIASFSGVLNFFAFLFAEEIVETLFGSSYLPVASLLWQYGLATMLFSLANLLIYYFLSLDHKFPVFVAMIFGLFQVLMLTTFNDSLGQIILVQIVNMGAFLAFAIGYYLFSR